jgi:glutathione S-transferase
MMKLYWAPRTRSLRALWVLEIFDVLEGAVAKGPFLLGESVLGGRRHDRVRSPFRDRYLKLVPSRPALRAYVDRCLARPALQRAKAIEAAGA